MFKNNKKNEYVQNLLKLNTTQRMSFLVEVCALGVLLVHNASFSKISVFPSGAENVNFRNIFKIYYLFKEVNTFLICCSVSALVTQVFPH